MKQIIPILCLLTIPSETYGKVFTGYGEGKSFEEFTAKKRAKDLALISLAQQFSVHIESEIIFKRSEIKSSLETFIKSSTSLKIDGLSINYGYRDWHEGEYPIRTCIVSISTNDILKIYPKKIKSLNIKIKGLLLEAKQLERKQKFLEAIQICKEILKLYKELTDAQIILFVADKDINFEDYNLVPESEIRLYKRKLMDLVPQDIWNQDRKK